MWDVAVVGFSPQEQREAAKHFAKTEDYIRHEMNRIEVRCLPHTLLKSGSGFTNMH